jgi:2-dehydropantoate 2-reductase
MRIAVMGAGAVGGYYGARLDAAGNEVWYIARGGRLKAMRLAGLQVESIDGDFQVVPVRVTDDPSAVGPVDLVLFTVKSTDTAEAARAMGPMVRGHTSVLALQNGVDNEAIIAQAVGEDRVLPGVAVVGVSMPEPGRIRHTNNGSITFGEVSGDETRRVADVRQTLEDAGIQARVSSDIRSVKWRKLVWNASFNPLAALTGRRVLELIMDDDSRTLAEDAMREAIAVGQALGYTVDGTLIEKATRRDPNWAHSKTSMLQDMERGRPTEIEALTGAVVRYGEETGVPTPVTGSLYRLVRAKERAMVLHDP